MDQHYQSFSATIIHIVNHPRKNSEPTNPANALPHHCTNPTNCYRSHKPPRTPPTATDPSTATDPTNRHRPHQSPTVRNKFDALAVPPRHSRTLLGFVTDMPNLTRCADVLVGKSGGLTIAEGQAPSPSPPFPFIPSPLALILIPSSLTLTLNRTRTLPSSSTVTPTLDSWPTPDRLLKRRLWACP